MRRVEIDRVAVSEVSVRTRIIVILFLIVPSVNVPTVVSAAAFGIVSGVVEDPQHRPVPQAEVTLRAQLSSWQERRQTDIEGKFSFPTVPAGEYTVVVAKDGFQNSNSESSCVQGR